MATEIVGARLQHFDLPGSMGVVRDTIYRQCFWPLLDQPFSPFAEGSAGIQVEGPPTPRNVVFPHDTIFLPSARSGVLTRADVHFLIESKDAQLDALASNAKVEIVQYRGDEVIVCISMADARAIAADVKKRADVLAAKIVQAEDAALAGIP